MTTVQEVMQKLSKANNLMEELIDMAMADEEITPEEKDILFSINENLSSYAKLIVNTVSDGEVDDYETQEIRDLEEKIVADAQGIAKADSRISPDELQLINQLIKTIQEL